MREPNAASERINRVGRYGGPDVRLQPLAADNIERAVEKVCDVLLRTGVVENGNACCRVEFDHDIAVAVGPGHRPAENGNRKIAVILPYPAAYSGWRSNRVWC